MEAKGLGLNSQSDRNRDLPIALNEQTHSGL